MYLIASPKYGFCVGSPPPVQFKASILILTKSCIKLLKVFLFKMVLLKYFVPLNFLR